MTSTRKIITNSAVIIVTLGTRPPGDSFMGLRVHVHPEVKQEENGNNAQEECRVGGQSLRGSIPRVS